MSIIVDVHEDKIYAMRLKNLGISVEVKHLEIGDVWVGNIMIEHKKIDDFFASVVSGRYYKQLYNMMINCNPENKIRPCVYITGSMPNYIPQIRGKGGRLTPINIEKTLRTNKIISWYSFGIPVFHTPSDDEYIKDIVAYFEKSGKISTGLKPNDIRKKSCTIKEIRSDILCAIPKIGRQVANDLASKYSIVELAHIDECTLASTVVGKTKLGNIKAASILEALSK